MNPVTLSNWLVQAFKLMWRRPFTWLVYVTVCGAVLMVSRISLALGIFLSVVCLFVGVDLAEYLDQSGHRTEPFAFKTAFHRSLPLAILAAGTILVIWFFFRLVASIYLDEFDKIFQFFWLWELTPENFAGKSIRHLSGWLFSGAVVILLFVLLMLTSFASWFSFPLMLFNDYKWSQAKALGDDAVTVYAKTFYQLMALVFGVTIIGTGILPMMTPFLYMWVSILMYVSYRDVFTYV